MAELSRPGPAMLLANTSTCRLCLVFLLIFVKSRQGLPMAINGTIVWEEKSSNQTSTTRDVLPLNSANQTKDILSTNGQVVPPGRPDGHTGKPEGVTEPRGPRAVEPEFVTQVELHVEPPLIYVSPDPLRIFVPTTPPLRPAFEIPRIIDGDPLRAVKLAAHVCGQKGTCGQDRSVSPCEIPDTQCHRCRCDENCSRFGDCCPDKYNFTYIQPYLYPDSCVSVIIKPSVDLKDIRYIMVDKCPIDSASTDTNVTESCEAASAETKPVYSAQTKFHYKNRFCALCNGITETVAWWVKAECRTVLNYSRLHTPEDFLTDASFNAACSLVSTPPEGSEVRECTHGSPLVSECPADWDDQAVARDCRKYRHPVTLKYRGTFKNAFCAICHGAFLGRPVLSCSVPWFVENRTPVPYAAMYYKDLDERRKVPLPWECADTEVFDTYQSKCRELFCPPGKVVNNHACVDLLPSAEGSAYKLHYSLIPDDSRGVLLYVDDLDALFTSYREHSSYIREYMDIAFEKTDIHITSFRPGELSGNHVTEWLRVFNITVQSRVVVGASVPRKQLEAMLLDFVRRGWAFYNKPTNSFEAFTSIWLPERPEEELIPGGFVGVPTVENHKSSYLSSNSRIPNPSSVLTDRVFLEVNELMDCNLIELSPDEFEVHGENAIMERATGKLLLFGQYVYAGDAVRVCTHFTGQKVTVSPLRPEGGQVLLAVSTKSPTSAGPQTQHPVAITCIYLLTIFVAFLNTSTAYLM